MDSVGSASNDDYDANWLDYLWFALSIMILIIGFPGNVIVIIIVKTTRSMWTTTNFLLVNLACADLLSLILGPLLFFFDIVHPKTQLSADYLCKFITGSATLIIATTVSVTTLMIIALERYRALAFPFRNILKLTEENIVYAIGATWVVGVATSLPAFVEMKYDTREKWCTLSEDGTFYIVRIALFSFVPAVVIGCCYFGIIRGLFWTNTIYTERQGTQERKADIAAKWKLCKLLILVTTVFYLSHLPSAIIETYWRCLPEPDWPMTPGDKSRDDKLNLASEIAYSLLFLSAAVNPLIYAFNSSNYREGFRKLLRCKKVRDIRDRNPQNRSGSLEMDHVEERDNEETVPTGAAL